MILCLYAKKTGDFTCTLAATQQKLRDTSLMKGSVYPWTNYDFNYSDYMTKKYTPYMNQLSTGTTIEDTMKNIGILVDKLAPALITDANPDTSSKPAISDAKVCIGKLNTPACRIMNNIKKSYLNQPAPYKNFWKDLNSLGQEIIKFKR